MKRTIKLGSGKITFGGQEFEAKDVEMVIDETDDRISIEHVTNAIEETTALKQDGIIWIDYSELYERLGLEKPENV